MLAPYGSFLQTLYATQTPRSSTEWPPVRTNQVFKLAIIKKEKVPGGKIDEKFVHQTMTGKVKDILEESNASVDLGNIFTGIQEEQKFVVLEGAPGSGKSTLALFVCKEWAEQSLFQEYAVVIHVKLRDPQLPNARSIADLLPCSSDKMAEEAEAAMTSVLGSGVL